MENEAMDAFRFLINSAETGNKLGIEEATKKASGRESRELEKEEEEESREKEKREILSEIDEASEIKNLKKIEAALFIAGKWLDMQELIMLTDINPILIRELMEKLIEKYSNEKSAIEILTKENIWKMDVKEEHANMVNKLATGSSEFSRAEQETLAIIAYKQPVKQSVIIKIRGNKAYEHVKKFRELGLVKAKRAGHTLELNLSEDFYNYFHVSKPSEVYDHARNSESDEEFRHVQNPKEEKKMKRSE